MWDIVYTRQAMKDAKKLGSSNLKPRALELLDVISKDPFKNPPAYEALKGDLEGLYSRRITIQHRLVYQVLEKKKTVKVLRMWTHYD